MKFLLIVLVFLLLPLKGFSQISNFSFSSETLPESASRDDARLTDVVVSINSDMGDISIRSNESISKVEVISKSGTMMTVGGHNSLMGEDVVIPILGSSMSLMGEDVVIPILGKSKSLMSENVYVVIVTTESGEVVIKDVVVQ